MFSCFHLNKEFDLFVLENYQVWKTLLIDNQDLIALLSIFPSDPPLILDSENRVFSPTILTLLF